MRTLLICEHLIFLTSFAFALLQTFQSTVRTLSAKVTGLLAEAEGTSFRRHVATLLPLIEKNIDPEKYTEVSTFYYLLQSYIILMVYFA